MPHLWREGYLQTDVVVFLQLFGIERGNEREFTLLRLSWRFFLRSLTAAVRCLMLPELFYGKGIHEGKKYGNLVGCFVRCRLGGASGLHSAETWGLHLTQKRLPGGQPRQDRDGAKD